MFDRGDPADEVERMDIPFVAFLLRNGELNCSYLVDCGPDFDNETNARLHQPMTMLPHWHVKEHLARLGVAPESLGGIIVTHLLWDHFKAAVDLPSSLPAIVQSRTKPSLRKPASKNPTFHNQPPQPTSTTLKENTPCALSRSPGPTSAKSSRCPRPGPAPTTSLSACTTPASAAPICTPTRAVTPAASRR